MNPQMHPNPHPNANMNLAPVLGGGQGMGQHSHGYDEIRFRDNFRAMPAKGNNSRMFMNILEFYLFSSYWNNSVQSLRRSVQRNSLRNHHLRRLQGNHQPRDIQLSGYCLLLRVFSVEVSRIMLDINVLEAEIVKLIEQIGIDVNIVDWKNVLASEWAATVRDLQTIHKGLGSTNRITHYDS